MFTEPVPIGPIIVPGTKVVPKPTALGVVVRVGSYPGPGELHENENPVVALPLAGAYKSLLVIGTGKRVQVVEVNLHLNTALIFQSMLE
jgi:hypothetical protein